MITDLSYLRSMSDDDKNFIREMAEIFREQILEFSVQMPELLEKSDFLNLSRAAHKAKSSVAVMGMAKEAEMLKNLEIKAKEELEVETYGEIIDIFIKNSNTAIEELDNYLNK